MVHTIAIVGANLAGGHAAHQLRRSGFDGRVVLIGAEPHLPYERPPLSKEVLLGRREPKSTEIWSEAAYVDAAIDVVLGTRVTEIAPRQRRVALDDGRSLDVDRVLLCTGAHPRRLDVPGIEQEGVLELRSLDDAARLRDELQPGAHVVTIGAGFIGAEVAAAAAQRGCVVTLVEVAPLPLQRVLGPQVGRLYAELHRRHGVDVRLGVVVEAVSGDGRCRCVELADGTELPADVVVCGVGVMPATELADAAGIIVANGVVVDDRCRSSIGEVFAAGDVAARPSSFATGHVRLESWQNAQNQSIAAANAMLGSTDGFDDVPWFWSDQYDVNLQIAGFPSASDEVVWRGTPESFDCTAFYRRDGVVTAAVGLNRPRDVRASMDMIRARTPVDEAVLRDESVDLRKLRSSTRAP